MKRAAIILGLVLFGWLSTGWYIVRGNEKAVVRRFGRVQRTAAGTVALQSSGLHFDMPWPLSQIDRVNLNEVILLTVGSSQLESFSDDKFLQPTGASGESRFLTGDKNILNVKLGIQYRIAEEQVDAYLFGTNSPQQRKQRLQSIAESVLSELVVRSGVDFVHTHGRSIIQSQLTERVRTIALQQQLGVRVDTVTLDAVEPPLRVRAAFLDVNDARADKEKYIHAANAYAAERQESAAADAQQVRDAADIDRRQTAEQARAESESFAKLISRLSQNGDPATIATARRTAMQRLYLETMEDVLKRVKSKVILQSGKPVDLTIFRDPKP